MATIQLRRRQSFVGFSGFGFWSIDAKVRVCFLLPANRPIFDMYFNALACVPFCSPGLLACRRHNSNKDDCGLNGTYELMPQLTLLLLLRFFLRLG